MSGPSTRLWLLKPCKISELIVDTDSDEARVSGDEVRVSSDIIQLREVLKLCQGCHNLNCIIKQPVVTSPAVLPLTKRMPVRVGQVNRFNRQ